MYKYQTEYAQICSLIEANGKDMDAFAEALRKLQIQHLSFSQISTVESCGFRYLLQYIESRDPEPYPDYFDKGKIFHQIIARRYEDIRNNRSHDEDGDWKYIRDNYKGSHRLHLENAVAVINDNIWNDYQVEAIEYPFVTILDQSLPPFVGVIDLILRRDHAVMVIDHKTGRDFNDPDLLQMSIYRGYVQDLFPDHSIQTYYDHYRWVENLATIRKPAMQRREVTLSDLDYMKSKDRVRRGFAQIEKIRRHHRPERDGNCFPCPYRGNCYF